MRFRALLLAFIVLAVAASADASAPRFLPPVQKNLTAKRSAKRTCAARLRSDRRRGIERVSYRAPMSGFVNVRLSGPRRGDWDVAVFERKSRRLASSSQAFGSRELAQAWVAPGERLAIQACRRSGHGRHARVSIQFIDVKAPKTTGVPQLLRVDVGTAAGLHRLESLGVDVTEDIHNGKAEVIVTGAKQRDLVEKAGFSFKTVIADMNKYYADSRKADLAFTRRVGKSSLPTGRTTYRDLIDYQTEMKALVDRYPDRVRPVTLPEQTTQGRPIQGVEISKNVNAPEDGRPTFFLMGMHHAREWPSGEIAMEYAHMLAEDYGSNARVTNIVDNARVVVVPIINVDSFVFTREAVSPTDTFWYGGTPLQPVADTTLPGNTPQFGGQDVGAVPYTGEQAVGAQAYRRKTCSGAFPAGSPCEIQWGTDPNRNYGAGWGGIGASASPHDLTYRGPGPWSEPETTAVHEFSQSRQVTTLITLHNYAALVLRPPGRHTDGLAPDEQQMKELGDRMADATGYRSQYGWELYDTSGTTEDWNYAAAGTFGYTIELGPGSDQSDTPENYDPDSSFHMPYDRGVVREWDGWGPNAGQGMREALLIAGESAINTAYHSIISGTAPAGRVLRLHKDFNTETSQVCRATVSFPVYFTGGPLFPVTQEKCAAPEDAPRQIADHLDTTMTVPASGTYQWHVTPSTRPFQRYRYVNEGDKSLGSQQFGPNAGETMQPYSLDTEHSEPQPSNYVERDFTIPAGADHAVLTLDWTARAPEDYDLYLWRKAADGSWQPAGTGADGDIWAGGDTGVSGHPTGDTERIDITDSVPGDYRMRVVDYTAPGDDWSAKAEWFQKGTQGYQEIGKEDWTLTCESPDGSKVYETHQVFVDRGQQVTVNMPCGAPTSTKKPKKPKPPKA